MSQNMSIVRLESSDKVLFEVHYDVIKCSETIRKALQDLGDEDDFGVLPVPKVSSQILEMVLNWATYHKNDIPKVIDEDAEEDESMEKRTDDICAWDTNFLNVDQGILYEIILAANYLNIQNLLHTTYRTVANMIKGKTTEQIRQTFSLVNDFTPEEEEEMRREADWCKWD